MRREIMYWARRTITREMIEGKKVIEAGARNVNGSLKEILRMYDPDEWVGVDIEPGDGVDFVMHAENVGERWPERFDVAVCTEMLEHAERWQDALTSILRSLKPGGLLILSTCAPGFPLHDYPGDHWRFTPHIMRQALRGSCTAIRCTYTGGEPGIVLTATRGPGTPLVTGEALPAVEVRKPFAEARFPGA